MANKIHMLEISIDFGNGRYAMYRGFTGEDLQALREEAKEAKKELLAEYPKLDAGNVTIKETYFAQRENRPELRGIIEK